MSSIRVLIVDDHEITRRAIRSFLLSYPELQICGEAVDGLEAVDKVKSLRPDVVLMDISMPRMNGLEATKVIKKENPESKVIIVSQNDPAIVCAQAHEAGAAAYVSKKDIGQSLLSTLRSIGGKRQPEDTANRGANKDSNSRSTWVAGDGEMARLIREKDWSRTLLGPLENWPQSLRIAVNLMLNSRHPMWVGWGLEMPFLYNDAYISVLGLTKHPNALGRPASYVWLEIWNFCGPLAEKVFEKGEASFVDDVRLFMNRGGFLEENFISFSYNPIFDEAGKIAGLFCPNTDTTPKILNARRLKTLSELAAKALVERSADAAYASSFGTIAKNPDDIPFALLYLLDGEGKIAFLEQCTGISLDLNKLSPSQIDLREKSRESDFWRMNEILAFGLSQVVSLSSLASIPLGLAGQPLKEAIVLPVTSGRQDRPIGLLIAGVNPTRKLDSEYQTFYGLLAAQVASAIQNARAAEEDCKRAEALAEIDRDITERGRAEEELRKSEEKLRNLAEELETQVRARTRELEQRNAEVLQQSDLLSELSQRLLQTQDHERRHIARELHDSAGQIVTVLSMQMARIGELATRDSSQVPKVAEDCQQLVQQLSQEIRTTSYLLYPPLLDEAGLNQALSWYIEGLIQRSGLEVKLSIPEGFGRLPREMELIVYRLVQECLTNIHRHSESKSAHIRLRREGKKLSLEIQDAGKGIQPEKLNHLQSQGGGVGIRGMRERIRQFDGSMKIKSNHSGTTISFEFQIPVNANSTAAATGRNLSASL